MNASHAIAATECHADSILLANAERVTVASTDDAILAGLQSETLAESRAALVAMLDTPKGANRAAYLISADAALNADAIAAYQAAKNEGRETETPRAVTTYILTRRNADKLGTAFTVSKKGGEFFAVERTAKPEANAKKKTRAARVAKGSELTDAQAMKQIRHLLQMMDTSNADTVAAVAALLKRVPAAKPAPKQDTTTAGQPRAAVVKQAKRA